MSGEWYGTYMELPQNPNFQEIKQGIELMEAEIDMLGKRVELDMSTLRTQIKGNELGFFQIGWCARRLNQGEGKDVSAADAVEVVRCKDCKNRGTHFGCPMRKLVMPVAGPGSYEDYTEDDGYCHMGVRKGGGTE